MLFLQKKLCFDDTLEPKINLSYIAPKSYHSAPVQKTGAIKVVALNSTDMFSWDVTNTIFNPNAEL